MAVTSSLCYATASDLFPFSLYICIYTQWLSPTVYYHRLQYNICTPNTTVIYLYTSLDNTITFLHIRYTSVNWNDIFYCQVDIYCIIEYINCILTHINQIVFLLINYETIKKKEPAAGTH